MTIRFLSAGLVAASALGLAASLAAQPAPVAPAAAPAHLPDGPGRETLLRVCSGCHAPDIVAQQRMTPQDWHNLVEQMAGNGAQGNDAEFAEITAYLTKSFPAEPGK